LFNRYSLFIRGLGGFGGDKGPKENIDSDPPQRAPDIVFRQATLDNQALFYRLSGDMNPLHADPSMAAMGNFSRPILHGLCSFGFSVRAVLKHFADNDASRFKSVRVRFVKHVFPGETLITEMWAINNNKIHFRAKVAERGDYVLAGGVVELHGDPIKAAVAAPAPAPAPAAPAAAPKSAPKSAAAPPAAPPAASSGGDFVSVLVFDEIKKRVDAQLVQKVKGTFRFDLNRDQQKRSWSIDLKNGNGSVSELPATSDAKADCTIIMSDADFLALMTGKLNAQQAFMNQKLKMKGNIALAQKLSLLSSAPSKL